MRAHPRVVGVVGNELRRMERCAMPRGDTTASMRSVYVNRSLFIQHTFFSTKDILHRQDGVEVTQNPLSVYATTPCSRRHVESR